MWVQHFHTQALASADQTTILRIVAVERKVRVVRLDHGLGILFRHVDLTRHPAPVEQDCHQLPTLITDIVIDIQVSEATAEKRRQQDRVLPGVGRDIKCRTAEIAANLDIVRTGIAEDVQRRRTADHHRGIAADTDRLVSRHEDMLAVVAQADAADRDHVSIHQHRGGLVRRRNLGHQRHQSSQQCENRRTLHGRVLSNNSRLQPLPKTLFLGRHAAYNLIFKEQNCV